jgi:hypothetical protein
VPAFDPLLGLHDLFESQIFKGIVEHPFEIQPKVPDQWQNSELSLL